MELFSIGIAMILPNENSVDNILTERLILRNFKENDLLPFYKLYSDYESSILDDWDPLQNIDQAKTKIIQYQKQIKMKTGIIYVIADNNIDTFIGCIGLCDFNFDSSNCSIFYQIEKIYRNNGYATEAVRNLTNYGLQKLHIHRIYAYVTPGNTPSIKVLENCGYKYEGTLREMEFYKGKYWDGIVYAIIGNN